MFDDTDNLQWTTACSSLMDPSYTADYCEPQAVIFPAFTGMWVWDVVEQVRVASRMRCTAKCVPSRQQLSCQPRLAAVCGLIGGGEFKWNGVQPANPAAVSWDVM
jgi:hypothetical protein